MISLGLRPEQLTLFLTRRADFVAAMIADPGPWPDTAMVSLVFRSTEEDPEPVTWAATIDGDRADWSVDKVLVDAVLNSGRDQVQLLYVETSGTELTWGRGVVISD